MDFPGAGFSDQAEDFAGIDREAQVADGGNGSGCLRGNTGGEPGVRGREPALAEGRPRHTGEFDGQIVNIEERGHVGMVSAGRERPE